MKIIVRKVLSLLLIVSVLLPILSAGSFTLALNFPDVTYSLGELIVGNSETTVTLKASKAKASAQSADITLLVGESTDLFVNVKDSNGNPVTNAPLKWSVTPEGVVSLKTGSDTRYVTITGLYSKNSPATVTASLSGTTKSVTVEVIDKDVVAPDGTTISFSEDEYEYNEGEEFPLSGDLYSPKGTNGITLEWSTTGENGVSINTPASMINTDANHIIFSALATGKKEGNYLVSVKTSTGASSSRRVYIAKKAEHKINLNNDAWSFKNPSNKISEDYWKTFYPNLSAEALKKAVDKSGGGLCYGMSATSMCLNAKLLYKDNYVDLISASDFGQTYVKDIKKASVSSTLNISALDFIKIMHTAQVHPMVAEQEEENKNNLQALYDAVKAYEVSDKNGLAVNIGITGKYFGDAAHSIWGIRTIDYNDRSDIIVYDSNHPKEERTLSLYKDANGSFTSWSYKVFDGILGAFPTHWGTGKKNASITFSTLMEVAYAALYNLKTGEDLGDYFSNQWNEKNKYILADIETGNISAPSLSPVTVRNVIELDYNGDPESDEYSFNNATTSLYWSKSKELAISGESGASAEFIFENQSLSFSSNKSTNGSVSINNDNLETQIISTPNATMSLKFCEVINDDLITCRLEGISQNGNVSLQSIGDGIVLDGDVKGTAFLEINGQTVSEETINKDSRVLFSYENENQPNIAVVSNETGAIKSIAVKTKPSKTTYNVNDTLNTSGLTLTVTYISGKTETVSSGFSCNPTKLTTAGQQTITVTYQGKTTAFVVTVSAPTQGKVKSVSIDDLTINYKSSTTIKPKIDADDGVKYTVKYESSNPKVASIDENGNVKALKKGNATITATVTDQYGNVVKDTCKVTVKYTFIQWIIKILLFGWIWY